MAARRKKFLLASALAPLALRYPAGAAEFSYKVGLNFPVTLTWAAHAAEAADKITRESGGRLEIKVFPSGQLGSGPQLISQVRLGAIEFTFPNDFDLSAVVQVAGITGLPFIVSDRKRALSLLEGPFGSYIHAAIEKVGIFQFSHSWDGGFLEIQNALRPVNVPADAKGLKLRTTNSAAERAAFQAAGATPVEISPPEVYASLQSHLVDGTTLSLSATEQYKLYEVEKYISFSNHSWIDFTMMANLEAWKRLPRNLQDLVDATGRGRPKRFERRDCDQRRGDDRTRARQGNGGEQRRHASVPEDHQRRRFVRAVEVDVSARSVGTAGEIVRGALSGAARIRYPLAVPGPALP